jgi:hypothetical protein
MRYYKHPMRWSMENAKQLASLVVALGLLGTGLAQAQEASPAATAEPPGKPPSAQQEPTDKPAQSQPKGAADKATDKPAQPQRKMPPRRRSIQQIVGPVPTVNLGSPTYSPTLTPRAPGAIAPIGSAPITSAPIATSAPGAVPAPIVPAPAIINSCAGSMCTDASGSRYNIGTGNAGTNSQGRLCNQVGNTVQCF